MVKKSLRKVFILLMELIILAIFKAQANILTPHSVSRTSLPSRLLQSPPGNDEKLSCVESTIEECKHIEKAPVMASCITFNFFSCIRRIGFPTDGEKVLRDAKKCISHCLGNLEFVKPHHAHCLVHCFDRHI
jgi:hypothetical protein